eukprot:4391853-Lingulodinium_polyedra.AAC.1
MTKPRSIAQFQSMVQGDCSSARQGAENVCMSSARGRSCRTPGWVGQLTRNQPRCVSQRGYAAGLEWYRREDSRARLPRGLRTRACRDNSTD